MPDMTNLTDFPVARRWPPRNADAIQLYSFPTPNGIKVSAALEELGLAYDAHRIGIGDGDQRTPEFLSLNPYGKIPAIIDPHGPNGRPLALFESGAILLYLAEKTGKLIPADTNERLECLQWLFFQMAGIGPIFTQLGYFYKNAGKDIADKRPLERYASESRRLLEVLETRLDGRDFIMGSDYTIADIATFPWLHNLQHFYEAGGLVGLEEMTNVITWFERCTQRPASQKARNIPPRSV